MKRFILLISFICVSLAGIAQTPFFSDVYTPLRWNSPVVIKGAMGIPTGPAVAGTNKTGIRVASLFYDSTCHCAKIYKPEYDRWDTLGAGSSSGGGSGNTNVYIKDTIVSFANDTTSVIAIPVPGAFNSGSLTIEASETTTTGDVGGTNYTWQYDGTNKILYLFFPFSPVSSSSYRYKITSTTQIIP